MTGDISAAGDSGARRVQEVAMGYYGSQALYVAAKLGIADLLAGGPLTVAELAAAVGADEDSLFRILRLLARDGIFELSDERAVSQRRGRAAEDQRPGNDAGPGAGLRRGVLPGVRGASGRRQNRAGRFRITFGQGLFDYLNEHPDRGRAFDRAMGAGAVFFNSIPTAYDFSGITTVVDVGGGNGTLLGSILAAHPHLQGILYDAGPVVEAAAAGLRAQGVHERVKLEAGNFFNSIVGGGDAYLFSRILHDWTDEQCLTILANCRRAINPGGRILVVERLLPGAYATATDVNMLAVTGGRERSREEFAALMSQTGFELRQGDPDPAGVQRDRGRGGLGPAKGPPSERFPPGRLGGLLPRRDFGDPVGRKVLLDQLELLPVVAQG